MNNNIDKAFEQFENNLNKEVLHELRILKFFPKLRKGKELPTPYPTRVEHDGHFGTTFTIELDTEDIIEADFNRVKDEAYELTFKMVNLYTNKTYSDIIDPNNEAPSMDNVRYSDVAVGRKNWNDIVNQVKEREEKIVNLQRRMERLESDMWKYEGKNSSRAAVTQQRMTQIQKEIDKLQAEILGMRDRYKREIDTFAPSNSRALKHVRRPPATEYVEFFKALHHKMAEREVDPRRLAATITNLIVWFVNGKMPKIVKADFPSDMYRALVQYAPNHFRDGSITFLEHHIAYSYGGSVVIVYNDLIAKIPHNILVHKMRKAMNVNLRSATDIFREGMETEGEVLSELKFEYFKKKNVRRRVRKSAGKNLGARRFSLEIELEPEQFGFGEEEEIDEIAAWDDFQSEREDEKPESPSDWIERMRSGTRRSLLDLEKHDPYNLIQHIRLTYEVLVALENYWYDEVDDSSIDGMPNRASIRQAIRQAVLKTKRFEIYEKNTKNKRRVAELKRKLGEGQKSFPWRNVDTRKIIADLRRAMDKVRNDVKRKYSGGTDHLDDIIRSTLDDLEDVVSEWVSYHTTDEEEEFRNWLERNLDVYMSSSFSIGAAVENAESDLSQHLRLSWDFVEDGTPAVELTAGPLDMSDVKDLLSDLETLSLYETHPGLSAHVHIDKGPNWNSFDTLATILLHDQEEVEREGRIGEGRSRFLSTWARNPLPVFASLHIETRYEDSPRVFTAKNAEKYFHKSYGINPSTSSTDYRTIEFRYASSTLLANYKQIVNNIQYWSALMSVAMRKTVVHRRLKIGGTYYNVILVRDPSSPGGGLIQILNDHDEVDPAIRELLKRYGNKSADEMRKLQRYIELDPKERIKQERAKRKNVREAFEIGTDEYREHAQSMTPGQEVTPYKSFKDFIKQDVEEEEECDCGCNSCRDKKDDSKVDNS